MAQAYQDLLNWVDQALPPLRERIARTYAVILRGNQLTARLPVADNDSAEPTEDLA